MKPGNRSLYEGQGANSCRIVRFWEIREGA